MNPTPSISIDKAADMLNLSPAELTAICDHDAGHHYHHRTIYTNRIRFFERDIIKIRKQLKQNTTHQ